ncbi:MAG: nucleotidyltransferase substrate binding protein [Candidatus Eisenbacteria bacterium]|nr:nucleotidyltransferase substrate binding protein [Candidatus Eisenbacteria bacterium]MCC7141533.1 nucleotidyltransferase substrate binding protein [Candidatus Eisenbacteria bacterium]
MTLDCSSLRRAVASLDEALALERDAIVRDEVVQRFELTYELCWKFIRRSLADSDGSEAIESLARRDLFRLAARRGLIGDAEPWFDYHRARNESSHTYDERKADEVAQQAERFAGDARALLLVLESRHA